ncbi:trafficking protein particle complex subunit 4-like isoform X1 [Tripterygium wilfordii]|uniref:trafficking protein particle complex subunit 4-like isoform X1 n=1 Tax=Tripterygium wilfordii TaxID=458696 RepID=UPI0018F85C8E|nr:trafficking protein particle complex subunit 4-like isoform X1 [Tripterygium wilfordii]
MNTTRWLDLRLQRLLETNSDLLFEFQLLFIIRYSLTGNFSGSFEMAAIYSLYIINKSGGLIFYKDYGSAGRMDTNDSLRVASLWHSMHAISQQLSPTVGCSGIELLEADTFDLHCFQPLTGTKFFVVCEPGTLHMESLLKVIYELYSDYVLKNPFYEMEMPIRCDLFDIHLTQAIQKDRVALLG